MTPEEFRTAAHELVDWVADHRERIPTLPVAAQVKPGEIRAALPTHAPEQPESLADVLADLDRIVVPGITQTQHPGFYGWFPSNASLASVLGDIASGGIAGLGITWQSAPALTEVEQVVTDWLRDLCGLDESWRGAIQDTASTGTLVAMLAARERAGAHSQEGGGLQSVPQPLVAYTSPQAHSSVPKAVLLAGFGRDNLRFVAVDPDTFAMRPDALEAAMAADVAAGRRPAVVIAAIGTTGTCAMDPVPEIVRIARSYAAWVHVDAAMAGSAMLLPEMRHLFAGVDDADSLGWNPHKWLGTILDCSLLYVRDVDHLVRCMSTTPSYLRSAVDDEVVQYKDWGIPLGRRFRALKLWFHLRLEGAAAIRARLRRDLANAQWFAEQVATEPDWRILAPVDLQTVCIRHEPAGLDGEALDRHTLAWADAINTGGAAFVSPSQLDGRWMVRISIGAEATERADVAALWDLMRASVTHAG
ncbi:MAG: pyridoxal-dependent decarboxylase [Dermatophilaceae bacterium]